MKHRRLVTILISLAMVVSYTPCIAFAAEATADEGDMAVLEEAAPDQVVAHSTVKLEEEEILLEDYLLQEAAQEAKSSAYTYNNKNSRGSKLTGNDKIAYNTLKAGIEEIADGAEASAVISVPIALFLNEQQAFTAADLNVESIVADGKLTDEAKTAFKAKISFDLTAVFNALLVDLPYDLYWFDKTAGLQQASDWNYGADTESGEWMIYATAKTDGNDPAWLLSFRVAKAYSKTNETGTTDIDTDKTETAKDAADYAAAIVTDHKDDTDLEKVTAYKNEICRLVSYDSEELETNPPYGDLWQMIYVFDDDTTTNVVCEGYSKAFQFLCDITEFNSTKTESHLVTGDMSGGTGAGAHMWNILQMNDDKNYLVDVTNCDEGTIGYSEYLFLKGCQSGSVGDGYQFLCRTKSIAYTYDADTRYTYAKAELELSDSDYVEIPDPCSHEWNDGEITTLPTCTTPGVMTFTCSKCSDTRTEPIPIDENAHNYQEVADSAKAPTCTEAGKYADVKCSRCQKVIEGDVIDALGHSMTKTAAKAATYTAAGNKAYYHCSRCLKYFSDAAGTNRIAVNSWIIPKLTKKAQPMKVAVTTKTVKVKTLKKKALTVTPITVKNYKGKLSFKLVSGDAKSKKALKLNTTNGKITVKKKTKKGTYKLKIKVTAAGTTAYKAGSKNVTITVKAK